MITLLQRLLIPPVMNCKLSRRLKLKITPCNIIVYIMLAMSFNALNVRQLRAHVILFTITDKEDPNTCLKLLENLGLDF